MQITEQQDKAANEIVELIANELGKNSAIHPGTAIASCARLSGSFMFRSFNFPQKDITPGTAVLSEQANEKGLILFNFLQWLLKISGTDIDKHKLSQFPKAESDLNVMDTLNLLQNKAMVIMNQYKFSFEEMAFVCAMSTAFIINECKKQLAVESGFNTAVFGFIEGSKTFPPPFSNESGKTKNIFKFWK